MKLGLQMFPTEYSIDVRDLARAAEDLGYESVFVPEHTHIPAARVTPYPAGGELPKEYSHCLDPFVALTAAAMVTERLHIGVGVCLVVERDPIVLAKEVATIDRLSGGRFLFGVGAGWNREEMANHGTDAKRRFDVLRERIEAMQALWTQDEATYHGEFVSFDRVWQWPKPLTSPYPPILVGGYGPSALERTVAYGDEWAPIVVRGEITRRIAELQKLAADAGRGPIPVTLFAVRPDKDVIRHYDDVGAHRCVFILPSAPADVVLPLMREWAKLAA